MYCRSLEHRYLQKSESIPFQRKVVVFVFACAIVGLNSCKRYSDSHRESAADITQKIIREKRNAPTLPPCPDAPYAKLNAKDPATGHHRVYLTWNASLSASGSDPNSLGYCLYRSQTAGKAKDCPKKYRQCEQVNVVPVRGTHCVDELVKDNTTYYYVAIGINSANAISTTSEEAIAEVPAAGKLNPAPPGADSYPACRVPVASSQPARH
jgi:hypothetical protein